MTNPEIEEELNGLRNAVIEYLEVISDLAHMIDKVEAELEDEGESTEDNYEFVKEEHELREGMMRRISESSYHREIYCWNRLLSLLRHIEEKES